MFFLYACDNQECFRIWADPNTGVLNCPFCDSSAIRREETTVRMETARALHLLAEQRSEKPPPEDGSSPKHDPDDGKKPVYA
jgi:hypothetical protein